MKRILIFAAAICMAFVVQAQKDMLGEWKTIDDKTGKEKSIVRIFKATNGLYYGKIEQLLQPSADGKPRMCTECQGADKNKPMVGLVIVRDMKFENGSLVGGTILDPANGKTYYASIELESATGKLKVRGSLDKHGLLGRSQFWVR